MLVEKTESLCPVCLNRLAAETVAEDGGIYLTKVCPDHGEFKTVIWRGTPESYVTWGRNSANGGGPEKVLTQVEKGCPYDCGPCPNHTEGVCLALIEVNSSCNIRCPVCFSSSSKSAEKSDPDLGVIERRFKTILSSTGPVPVQLSGGEPTLRDDLPEIAALGRQLGFELIQVNTNGVRLAEDKAYLARLHEKGAQVLYLQFDGVTDDVYRVIRGGPLMSTKIKVLENCSEVGMAVVLVPTLVPGVNDSQIGDIIRFAKQRMPVVRGVHFQPVSYFGRYPHPPHDEDRITIPDVLAAIERQTEGEIRPSDFKPRISQDAHCAFAGFFILGDDNRLTSAFSSHKRSKPSKPAPAVRSFLEQYWSPTPGSCSCKSCCSTSDSQESLSDDLFGWVHSRALTISGMPFQDVWNIDLRRLKGCCIFVATESSLVPFCTYYATSAAGRRLYGQ